jgi:hypothetical protein
MLFTPMLALQVNAQEPGTAKSALASNALDASGPGCVAKEKLTNKLTPVDLYRGISTCIEQENFEPGVFMYAMAGAYGRFDTLRVADESAHQAAKILPLLAFDSGNKDKIAAFKAQVGQILGNDAKRASYCSEVERIDPPDYFPSYMVQHGLGALTGAKTGEAALVPSFNPEVAWKQAVVGYLQCPALK